MKTQNKISVIVIARNEEKNLHDCLKTVDWVDEIIVVDDGSEDKTVEIAKNYGARVFEKTGGSFSELRNKGAKESYGEWLLYIDADEKVTPLLREEIKSKIQARSAKLRLIPSAKRQSMLNSKFVAYAVPRKNILLGKEMKYGGWWPDYVLRLIKKDSLKAWVGELHEQPEVRGEIGKLENPLIHNTHRNLTEMVEGPVGYPATPAYGRHHYRSGCFPSSVWLV